jgi:hypothetical protein
VVGLRKDECGTNGLSYRNGSFGVVAEENQRALAMGRYHEVVKLPSQFHESGLCKVSAPRHRVQLYMVVGSGGRTFGVKPALLTPSISSVAQLASEGLSRLRKEPVARGNLLAIVGREALANASIPKFEPSLWIGA